MPLPTKNISIFIALAAMLIGIASVVAVGRGPIEETTQNPVAQQKEPHNNTKDSDGDGLMDWEETLWKTDPNNPDTDGDGTPDGQEVEDRRDPTIAGPDDALPETNSSSTSSGGGSNTTETNTELFSREIFGRFLQGKQSGVFNPESLAPVTGSLTQHFAQTTKITTNTFTESDLAVVEVTNERIRAYGNTMGALFKKYLNSTQESELAILGRAIHNDSLEELSLLDENISMYNTIIEEHLAVTVPKDAVDTHLALLREYQGLLDATKQMKAVFDDTLTAALAIQKYNEHSDELERAVKDLQQYFLAKPVIFTESESGYIFEK